MLEEDHRESRQLCRRSAVAQKPDLTPKKSLPRQVTPVDASDALATRLYPHVRQAVQFVGDVEPDETTLLDLADLALQASERAEALARASARADRATAEAAAAKLDVQNLHVERDSLIIDSTLDTELIGDLLRKIASLQKALCRAGQPEWQQDDSHRTWPGRGGHRATRRGCATDRVHDHPLCMCVRRSGRVNPLMPSPQALLAGGPRGRTHVTERAPG